MGKITVIKSLAIPKLVYPMSVLPKPSEEILNLLHKLFRKFIWGTSKPRMTLSQLEQDFVAGGLKLTNLFCLNDALKLAWIKRTFIKCGDWQTIFEKLSDMDKNQIWELDCYSLEYMTKRMGNLFWEEVLIAWKKYKLNFEKRNRCSNLPPLEYFLLGTSKPNFEEKRITKTGYQIYK